MPVVGLVKLMLALTAQSFLVLGPMGLRTVFFRLISGVVQLFVTFLTALELACCFVSASCRLIRKCRIWGFHSSDYEECWLLTVVRMLIVMEICFNNSFLLVNTSATFPTRRFEPPSIMSPYYPGYWPYILNEITLFYVCFVTKNCLKYSITFWDVMLGILESVH
jgi:hypothetical protein